MKGGEQQARQHIATCRRRQAARCLLCCRLPGGPPLLLQSRHGHCDRYASFARPSIIRARSLLHASTVPAPCRELLLVAALLHFHRQWQGGARSSVVAAAAAYAAATLLLVVHHDEAAAAHEARSRQAEQGGRVTIDDLVHQQAPKNCSRWSSSGERRGRSWVLASTQAAGALPLTAFCYWQPAKINAPPAM